MDQQNTYLSKSAQHDLRKFLRNTILVFAMLLIVISAIRASLVLTEIHRAAAGEPYNAELAVRWSPAYPVLYYTLVEVEPDTTLTYQRRNRLLMYWPDRLIHVGLKYTRALWQPEMPTTPTQTPPAAPPTASQPLARTNTNRPDAHTNTPDATAACAAPPPATTNVQPETKPADRNKDTMWAAIIAPDAPIYDAQGQRTENVPAGSVVNITGQRSNTNGMLYSGTVHSPIGRFENIVIREQDLQLYRGKTLRETSREERERASDRARLQGAITARKQQIEMDHANRNPYQKRYHETLRRYQALRLTAQPLQDSYAESTGTERIDTGSRLREIQQEMTTLTPRIRELQQQRDAWNAANPQPAPPDPEQDPQIISLRRQLATLEP